jgi:hypothetical protein
MSAPRWMEEPPRWIEVVGAIVTWVLAAAFGTAGLVFWGWVVGWWL